MTVHSFVVASVLLLGSVTPTLAQTVPDNVDRPAFGLVGLSRGQSARVNVSINNPELRPGELPAGPCHVTLGFVNERNQPFTLGAGIDAAIAADGMVDPGGSLSLVIQSGEVFTAGGRTLLRPVVTAIVPETPDLPAGPCHGLASTLELLDNADGATRVLYGPGRAVPTSESEEHEHAFGLVGVVRGQSAELHLFINNPDLRPGIETDVAASCRVSLEFVDAAGSPVVDLRGRGATGVLIPGESLTLSLASADLFRAGEARRREIRAIVTGEQVTDGTDLPAGPCRGLVPTLEIVNGSGRTTILYFKQ